MVSLLCYLLFLSWTLASPVLTPSDAICASCPNVYPRHSLVTRQAPCPYPDTSPVFNTRYRSTIGILWSCLAVIFASTWICVHPNVAGYSTTIWQRLWIRLKLFVLAIFAPELLAVFAFFQWKGCRELHRSERFQRRLERLKASGFHHAEWTLTHAHFVQMGGIVFKDPSNGNVGFKKPNDWTNRDIKNFFALRLCEAAIEDKSKGSALAKTLVVMQILWFVVQTIARALERLPITHLEVVCLAFTVFNIGMYACWWSKPLDVEYPLATLGVPGTDSSVNMDLYDWMGTLMGGLDNIPVGVWIYSPRTNLYPSLYCYRKVANSESFINRHFSSENGRGLGGAFTLALSFTSATFGALHTIGWSLPSPTQVEYMLWRVCCLVLMCYPLVPIIIPPSGELLLNRAPKRVLLVYGGSMSFISLLGAIAYVGARLILLVLPFLELRALPPLAHQTVAWSNFLPHI